MITDYKKILKIARNSLKGMDLDKLDKIHPAYQVVGLYPQEIKKLDIKPKDA